MLLEGVLGSHGAGMDGSRNDARPSGWGWAPQTRHDRAGSFLGHAGERSSTLSSPLTTPHPHLPGEPLGSLAGPWAGPWAPGGRSGFRSGRRSWLSSGSWDRGLPGGGEVCAKRLGCRSAAGLPMAPEPAEILHHTKLG